MECKNCLIWLKHKEDISSRILELVPRLARFLHKDEVTENWKVLVSNEAKHLDSLFRQHISLIDNQCQSGKCVLI